MLGRPRKLVNHDTVRALHETLVGIRAIAKTRGVLGRSP